MAHGEFYIARNKELRSWIVDIMMNMRLPYKIMIQPIYPDKSLSQLAYAFGVVFKRIANLSGQSVDEVYQGYKELFNIEYSPDKNGVWALRYKGLSSMDTIDFEEFALMVRADALLECGVNIELPNEVFIDELNYSRDETYQTEIKFHRKVIQGKIPRMQYKVQNG